jgi:hypothetical protein
MLRARFQIASWPDEEGVVAEVLVGDADVGHVRARDGMLELTLYRDSSEDLRLDLADFIGVLSAVQAWLMLR